MVPGLHPGLPVTRIPEASTMTSPLVGRRSARGFTLLELVTGLATFGTLVAVAAPGVGSISGLFKLDGDSRTVALALTQARVAAITRSHRVDVSFGAHGFTVTDTEIGAGGYVVLRGDVLAPTTLSASGTASFTPLGTVTAPVTITLRNVDRERVVRLGLAGEVETE